MGYQAVRGDFLKIGMEEKPTVISMMDVYEHMPWPRKALDKVRDMLAPSGGLVISLLNMNSSSWRLMDQAKANPYWMEIEHHHNFSRPRLTALPADHGFEVAMFDIPFRYKAQMGIYAKPIG